MRRQSARIDRRVRRSCQVFAVDGDTAFSRKSCVPEARFGIKRGNISPLKAITVEAGQCEVFLCRFTAVLFSDDMIWFVREEGVFFADEAVFTQAT